MRERDGGTRPRERINREAGVSLPRWLPVEPQASLLRTVLDCCGLLLKARGPAQASTHGFRLVPEGFGRPYDEVPWNILPSKNSEKKKTRCRYTRILNSSLCDSVGISLPCVQATDFPLPTRSLGSEGHSAAPACPHVPYRPVTCRGPARQD